MRAAAARQRRLIFALDATASREPTWVRARALHADLFDAATEGDPLALQLCWYRGFSEFEASPWMTAPAELKVRLDRVSCLGGPTQISRLLRHYLGAGTPAVPVRAMVFVGDAQEEREVELLSLAGQCRIRNQPVFVFQEGSDNATARVFEQIAQLSGGAYARLDGQSSDRLRELLGAVVRYARGGRLALSRSATQSDKLLLSQLPPKDSCQD